MAYTEEQLKKELENKEYEYGFYTDIDSETFPKGLNEEIVIQISKKKNEPSWMTKWRLDAFNIWKEMKEPNWVNVKYKKPDFQSISYYSAPKKKNKYKSLDEVDPELLETFKKLGISIEEQKKLTGVASSMDNLFSNKNFWQKIYPFCHWSNCMILFYILSPLDSRRTIFIKRVNSFIYYFLSSFTLYFL